MADLTPMKALKQYLEAGKHGRKATLEELKAVSAADRKELGQLALEEIQAGRTDGPGA